MANENPQWGAPRIHGQLQKLGFTIAESTVACYLRRLGPRGERDKALLAFVQNHREVILALDSFTVPTVSFRMLYCFFVFEPSRRRIMHCSVTAHPRAKRVIQQLREALPEAAWQYFRPQFIRA